MRIALVHEWLTNMAGSEQCVLNFLRIWPNSPIYTSVVNRDRIDPELANAEIHTSFLQFGRKKVKSHQKYFPLMPFAFENFNFNDYDVILSSSHSCAKGIITKSTSTHICYCHTPIRYAWEYKDEYTLGMGKVKKALVSLLMHYIRLWDFASAQRVDYFIANSTAVQKRIKKYYRRDSVVIYPPVRCKKFALSDIDGDFFLVVSRLVRYKRFDLAVLACSKLNKKLIVVGSGPEEENLKKISGPAVSFVGYQTDDVVKKYMQECKALLFPGEEDFGIVPVEAEACGRPVIAYGMGGALDTIIDGKTGILFKEQTSESLQQAILKFESMTFDKKEIREHSLGFDESVFQKKIKEFIENKINIE